MQINATTRFRACRLSAIPPGEVEPIFPDCRIACVREEKLMGKMNVGFGLGNCANIIASRVAQQSLSNLLEGRIEGVVGNAGGAGRCGTRGQGTRQGANRGRRHTEPPAKESVRAFHRRARTCQQTRGRSELWGILTVQEGGKMSGGVGCERVAERFASVSPP